MSSIKIDESDWPLVKVTFSRSPSDAEVERYLTRADLALDRRDPYILLLRAIGLDTLSAKQRKRFSAWLGENAEALKKYCLGQAYVMPGVLQRMVLRSILMLQPKLFPSVTTKTEEEAIQWCVSQLEARGIQYPSAPK